MDKVWYLRYSEVGPLKQILDAGRGWPSDELFYHEDVAGAGCWTTLAKTKEEALENFRLEMIELESESNFEDEFSLDNVKEWD